MATATYTPIASITLGSSASSVTFSSIPQDYRDLVLVLYLKPDKNNFLFARLNQDSGNKYPRVAMTADGSSTNSFAGIANKLDFGAFISSDGNIDIIQIMDYSATDKHKTMLARFNSPTESTSNPLVAAAYGYADTNSINNIEFFTAQDFWTAGSTFALYGIEA